MSESLEENSMDKKGKSRKKEALYGILFVAPAAVGTLIFFLFTFLISVFYSFMDGVATCLLYTSPEGNPQS